MKPQKNVRVEGMLERIEGRELLEDELAVICGGQSSASSSNSVGFGSIPNLSSLANLLNGQKSPQTSKNDTNNLGNFPGFGSLTNLTGGLVSKLF